MAAHPHRPTISPLPNGTARPLWSVMIPTYNCINFLEETLSGVLSQSPGPQQMQIEVVDDHSSDQPARVVEKVGKDRVYFYRQPENRGHIENFATCLQRARGELIHLLHGDDCVRDGFYRKMTRAFHENPEIGAAFCRQIFIDQDGQRLGISPLEEPESGILPNALERLASEQRIMTPSIVVRREVYEKLGAFDRRLICSEDWEMWVRIAANYPIWYEPEPLALYRMHQISNTGRHIRSGDDMKYTRVAIDIFKSYLPREISESTARRARNTYAQTALDMAFSLAVQRDWQGARAQIREALKFRFSITTFWKATKLLLKAVGSNIRSGNTDND